MEPDKRRDLAYYRLLDFKKYEQWSEKDLSQFLMFDYFDGLAAVPWLRGQNSQTFLAVQRRKLKKYNRYKFLMDLVDWVFYQKYRLQGFWAPGRKKILFEGAHYPELIKEAKKHHDVRLLVHAQSDRMFAIRHLIGYLGLNDLDHCAPDYLENRDIACLLDLVELMERKLSIVRPDAVVLCMDMMVHERAIVLAAKKLGIKTVVVQHAMYDIPTCSLDFRVADTVFLWGQYFKDMCIAQSGRRPEDIEILGYPHGIIKYPNSRRKKKVVCYLGQDLENYDPSVLPMKMETIRSIDRMCREMGFDFFYRPHRRRESQKLLNQYLQGIKVTPASETLETAFLRADIFISFSSTALIEAALAGRISIQLNNYPIPTDDLALLGACAASLKTLAELKSYLAGLIEAHDSMPAFNSAYIETSHDVPARFMKLLFSLPNSHA